MAHTEDISISVEPEADVTPVIQSKEINDPSSCGNKTSKTNHQQQNSGRIIFFWKFLATSALIRKILRTLCRSFNLSSKTKHLVSLLPPCQKYLVCVRGSVRSLPYLLSNQADQIFLFLSTPAVCWSLLQAFMHAMSNQTLSHQVTHFWLLRY